MKLELHPTQDGLGLGETGLRPLEKEMYFVGNRPGHYRAFLNLLRNAESREIATKNYRRINVPVLLVWSDKDWTRPLEREHDRNLSADGDGRNKRPEPAVTLH